MIARANAGCFKTLSRPGWLGLLACLAFGLGVGSACNVPVFRYALERWPASPYEALVFHRGPLAAAERDLVTALQQYGAEGSNVINLALATVDLGGPVDAAHQALWQTQTNARLPWLLVRSPHSETNTPPFWAGPLTSETAKLLVDSPARREIAQRLLQGDSAVWLLLESGRKAADEALFKMVETELKKLQKTLELPAPAPDDPPMQATPPLRIAFSLVRAARSQPAEQVFVNSLVQGEPELETNTAPIFFPIFGRGRALAALPESVLTPRVVAEASEFICGPCSCQAKELNPGKDLLLAADWEGLMDGQVVKVPAPPPLLGLASFAPVTPRVAVAALNTNALPTGTGPSPLTRNLLLLLGLAVAAIVIGTLVLGSKTGK